MKTGILTLASPLHDAARLTKIKAEFSAALGKHLEFDFVDERSFASADFLVILIMTGGSENLFVQLWPKLEASQKPFVIAATPTDNSLPAAIEIISWLRQKAKNCNSHIIHGTNETLANEIEQLAQTHRIAEQLKQQVIGVIGAPSDWLIASMPDVAEVTRKFGINFKSIAMEEFRRFCDKSDSSSQKEFAQAFYGFTQKDKTPELARAARIYGGLSRCIKHYGLTALTLRCFDILAADQTTGCLGIAKLNDDGIPSSCEGDVPALLSMMLIRLATGQTSFMANPSRIENDEVTFAHCTCPVTMLENVSLKTHFESGIGLAVAGSFQAKTFTVLKIDPAGGAFAAQIGTTAAHTYSERLCRTQIRLKLPGAADYFLRRPLGNHHIIVAGDHLNLLKRLAKALNLTEVWQAR